MSGNFFTEQERKMFESIALDMLKQGKYNNEIAKHIGIGESTVARIVRKLISERKNNSR